MAVTDAGAFRSHVPDLCPRAWLSSISSAFFVMFRSCSHCWVKSLLQDELMHISYVSAVNEMCARLWFIMFCKCSVAEFLHPTASPTVRLDLVSNWDIAGEDKNSADRKANGR